MHLPPGFGGVNLPLPRATRESFASLYSIFSQLPFFKGGNLVNFIRIDQKSSPPFEKGRVGGISGKAFSSG
jgi:hypothetical protein